MKLYSTRSPQSFVSLKTAVLQGLPADNGLFMPESIPQLPPELIREIDQYTFPEFSYLLTSHLFQGAIPETDLRRIVTQAIHFPAPIVPLSSEIAVLELFHGPSLAFKDFGASFMAHLMAYLTRDDDRKLTILVATSGDTGGAVANGFLGVEGIEVIILYPSGKVSHLQELQLTTLGQNITALEIEGTFDDCQSLVKQAFLDATLQSQYRLSSANSINIARLIPQMFYYFEAYRQLKEVNKPLVYCVPSGNFGNLTAGLFAQKMGLPVKHFIAATNVNDVVPEYLETGIYRPRPSKRTLSNAMDVGNPSNFARMFDLYQGEVDLFRKHLSGYRYNDVQTAAAITEIYHLYRYIMDPHGAVGYLALKEWQSLHPNTQGIVLETAHPSKFIDIVESATQTTVSIPERLACLQSRKKVATLLPPSFAAFKEYLMNSHR